MSDMIKVSICDSKYTIIQDASGRTNVLRYGESWRDATGDNVILGAAYEIEKLQARIKQLEEAGDEIVWFFCPKESSQLSSGQSVALKQWNAAKEIKP